MFGMRCQTLPGAMSALKAALVALLVLILCIPLTMIQSIAGEREDHRDEAGTRISEMAGGQTALGAVSIMLPVAYTERTRAADGKEVASRRECMVYFAPDSLDIEGKLDSELRAYGIYKVPVYALSAALEARFILHPALIGLESAVPAWDRARILLEFEDPRSLKGSPSIESGGVSTTMRADQHRPLLGAKCVSAPISLSKAEGSAARTASVRLRLELGGAQELSFISMGAQTRVSLSGDWPSPSFSGYRLPAKRELGQGGFSAEWFAEESARPLPTAFYQDSADRAAVMSTAFGLKLATPVDLYQRVHRALRYGVIFLLIPFAALFVMEIIKKQRIHAAQYALIGLADLIFYLLLLSFSEHMPFGWAYLISAGAVTALIGAYAAGALKASKGALVLIPAITAQYAYLYFALISEDYALLIGSIGLFALVALIMFLTRSYDWYGVGATKPAGKTPDRDGANQGDGGAGA